MAFVDQPMCVWLHAGRWRLGIAVLGCVLAVPSAASAASTHVAEAGAGDSYEMSLASEPTAAVDIEVHVDPEQLEVTPQRLRFTTADWFRPQSVSVTAVDDSLAEGNHTAEITHVVVSRDGNYHHLLADTIVVAVRDNDLRKGVALLAPVAGAAIGPSQPRIELELADPAGVTAVAAMVDGERWFTEPVADEPVHQRATLEWGSGPAQWRDGAHTLEVGIAAADGSRTRQVFDVVVDATAPDPPRLTRDGPLQLHASGLLRVDATVSDAMGVRRAELLVDGLPVAAQSVSGAGAASVQFMVEPGVAQAGQHRLEVRAIDAAGNVTVERFDRLIQDPPGAPADSGDTTPTAPELPTPEPGPSPDAPRPDDSVDVIIAPPEAAPAPPATANPDSGTPSPTPDTGTAAPPGAAGPPPPPSRGPPA